MYPLPALVSVNPVIVPDDETVAVAVACVPPAGGAVKATVGAAV
jgi:hypothetical protein